MEGYMEITSLTNAKVKQWSKYKEKKYREQDHMFLIEGEHLIQEAKQAGIIEGIIVEQGKSHVFTAYPTYEVTKDILKKLSDRVSGTWIMAVCHYPVYETIGRKVIVLDDVQDPGNVGTIIRTALSFGYESVVLSKYGVDLYNDKLIRSTQGALFHLPIMRGDIVEILHQLKQQGMLIYATALQNATSLQQINTRNTDIALVFGNEGVGVSSQVLELSDYRVCIEMQTFESLNVAIAAAICMYEFQHRSS